MTLHATRHEACVLRHKAIEKLCPITLFGDGRSSKSQSGVIEWPDDHCGDDLLFESTRVSLKLVVALFVLNLVKIEVCLLKL